MKTLFLMLLCHASVQLQCDKTQVKASVGGEFTLVCSYNTRHFLYSKKYWCRGEQRSTCEILMDSEGIAKTKARHRSHIIDARRRGPFVKITNLQVDDSGVYWVGIDKIYADIMASIHVEVTEAPVSKPLLWSLSSLVDTCWGQAVTVRCGSTQGTSVHYAWYQCTQNQDILLQDFSDLHLHCGRAEEDSYYCQASNDVSSQRSDTLSVQVLVPADDDCIYIINIHGQSKYNCDDRLRTSTATSLPLTTFQAIMKTHHFETRNLSSFTNQSLEDLLHSREWTGLPLWYTILRWASFTFLLTTFFLVQRCT